jgi:hypothetical protein
LLLEAPDPDLSGAAEEHGSREDVVRLTFVQAGVDAAAQLDALQPGEVELGSFDPAQLARSDCKAVLGGGSYVTGQSISVDGGFIMR